MSMSKETVAETVASNRSRLLWVDNLRVLVVAGVIVVHTATGYITGFARWYYDELTTSKLWSTLLEFPGVAAAIFGLGPMFLLAGWFSPPSLAHRGPARFAGSRLLRLGVPLVGYLLLIQPLSKYVGSRRDDVRPSFLACLRSTELGVMWFVAAILVFSLVYSALRAVRPARPASRPPRLGRILCVAALAIAIGSLLVWQLWPWNSYAVFTARLGEWPQGAVLFALGVHGRERGWLDDLSPRRVRRLGWVTLAGLLATVALFVVLVARDAAARLLNDAIGWATPLFGVLDGVVAVSLSLWFLAWLRRRWPTHGPLIGKAARGSYATYLLHPLVLTTIMVLCGPLPLPPEVKFVLVSAVGVLVCFTVGFGATRLPVVSRVL